MILDQILCQSGKDAIQDINKESPEKSRMCAVRETEVPYQCRKFPDPDSCTVIM